MFFRLSFWIPLSLMLSAQTWELRDTQIQRSQDGYRVLTSKGQIEGANDDRLYLRYGVFDPLVDQHLLPTGSLRGQPEQRMQIIQFVVPPQQAFREMLAQFNAAIIGYLPRNAWIIDVDPSHHDALKALSYVRYLGPYHPAYRLPPSLRLNLLQSSSSSYNLLIAPNLSAAALKQRLERQGIQVLVAQSGKYLMRVELNGNQLQTVLQWDGILFVDTYSPLEKDMDVVREMLGADAVTSLEGFNGEGIRGEVYDSGFNANHIDFDHHPLIEHGGNDPRAHGASTSGIVFGDGTGNANARGMLPKGQGIIADSSFVDNRYDHTLELLGPAYQALFQTASVGSSRTTDYTTISADLDTIAFDSDLVLCQSQSNEGNQDSRPEAWAKNVLSVGGILHQGTTTRDDDCWCGGGSIGPAADGRIKPDLAAHYDRIETISSGNAAAYTANFGGTSGATPIVCGSVGLVYQMWQQGIFGNPITPGTTAFENRMHASTARALLINSAYRYDFNSDSTDLIRAHQGWGMPDLERLYARRDKLFIIDESELLQATQSITYELTVLPDEPALEATLVFADPAGLPAALMARVNDLDLVIEAPDGTIYYGNVGLSEGNQSVPGGSRNEVDTVENVFVSNPIPGVWQVSVQARELNADGHLETEAIDADFALVVAGAYRRGFGIDTNRSYDALCPLGQVAFDVELKAFLDFDVALNLTAFPPQGFEVSFATNPVKAPATVQATLSADGSVASGHYEILIQAEAEGEIRQVVYRFDFDRSSALRPEVREPINGAQAISVFPTLSWTGHEQVLEYEVQVSSDAEFNTILTEARVERDFYRLIDGLDPLTCYYWRVRGRSTCDWGPWAMGGFMTDELPDFLSQRFTSGFDLANRSLHFTPEESLNGYQLCTSAAATFPVDPSDAIATGLVDDSYIQISLEVPFPFFGQDYDELFVGSNGFVSFLSGDGTASETIEAHFNLPRISAFFDDLNPSQGGSVTFQETVDGLAITWLNVPEYDAGNQHNFQIRLSYDGQIQITYLDMDGDDAVVGLSRGGGLPFGFDHSDLSSYQACAGKGLAGVSYVPCQLDSCVLDITGDGFIDDADLGVGRQNWRQIGPGDVNADNHVSILDMIGLVNGYGICIDE